MANAIGIRVIAGIANSALERIDRGGNSAIGNVLGNTVCYALEVSLKSHILIFGIALRASLEIGLLIAVKGDCWLAD